MGGAPVDGSLRTPTFLQLAGHELRWQLLSELGRSDRRVGELTELVGQPQNLVSYHLRKLRDAELVSARRSSADGRDSYYTVDLARVRSLLAATGTALHPGLHLVPPSEAPGPAPATAAVLFLCTGNSARSQMAEALARVRSGGRVAARSAGSHPKPLHPNAVRAMREVHGIDLSGSRPTHLDDVVGERFDRVVSLCDRVREVCPTFPGEPEATHWSLADPAAGSADDAATYPAFCHLANELDVRIGFLLAALTPRSDTPAPDTPTPQEERP